ncbi:MAG: hypothetical protein ACKVJE_17225 [Pseudomonadales bacterium]
MSASELTQRSTAEDLGRFLQEQEMVLVIRRINKKWRLTLMPAPQGDK